MSDFQERAESAVTRWLLVGIFALGLVAQFVKPVGDALEDKAFLGGALLSLVGYALYSSVQRLIEVSKPAVRDRVGPGELAEHFEEVFEERTVSIGFIGYTGETLIDQLARRLDRLKTRPGPTRNVDVRILLPDFWDPNVLPGKLTAEGKVEDDPEFRAYLQSKIKDYRDSLERSKRVLDRGGVVDLRVEFRFFRMPAALKLYLMNDQLVFEGYYNKLEKTDFPFGAAADRRVLDPQGYNSMLTRWHHAGGKDATEAIKAWREYFDELWGISREPGW
ncbi:hypothetical protein SLUN_18325 [Streptomyces lunaelactis]|uniref:Uncharacterized protein n=1 Tax=Streptomyces lunaelactis TaxID=1535768 RepID=A0A2R4T413_9ACTN|nr:hypothetical protein [Streptomyces lunaelactis]AVZ73841.1 hypothetical protein SLUN_18325 [Streptomyces lunaelactis]NUK90012.1 hypothetical protein [Streptomyces lunaelactis]